jgi:hypothetical protein
MRLKRIEAAVLLRRGMLCTPLSVYREDNLHETMWRRFNGSKSKELLDRYPCVFKVFPENGSPQTIAFKG